MHYIGMTGRGDAQATSSGRVAPNSLPYKAASPQKASFKSDAEAVERLLQCPLTKVSTTVHMVCPNVVKPVLSSKSLRHGL